MLALDLARQRDDDGKRTVEEGRLMGMIVGSGKQAEPHG
jgi:hypothetical protein